MFSRKKKCTLCKAQIEKGKEIVESVKVPEWQEQKKMPFCSVEHAEEFKETILGTPRTSYCPSCGI